MTGGRPAHLQRICEHRNDKQRWVVIDECAMIDQSTWGRIHTRTQKCTRPPKMASSMATSAQSSAASKPNWTMWALGAAGAVGLGALAYFWLRPTSKHVFRGHHAFGARTAAEKAVDALDQPYFTRKTLIAMYHHLESMTAKSMKIDREEFRKILMEIGACVVGVVSARLFFFSGG